MRAEEPGASAVAHSGAARESCGSGIARPQHAAGARAAAAACTVGLHKTWICIACMRSLIAECMLAIKCATSRGMRRAARLCHHVAALVLFR